MRVKINEITKRKTIEKILTFLSLAPYIHQRILLALLSKYTQNFGVVSVQILAAQGGLRIKEPLS